MARARRKSMVYDIPRKIARYARCQKDWSNAKWKLRSEHRRMIATMSSVENSTKLLPNWIERHQLEHRKRLIHRLRLPPTKFHVSLPHFVRISGIDMKWCFLWKQKRIKIDDSESEISFLTYATRNMHHWSFFTETQSGRHRQHEADRFHQQCPFTQIAANDESR